MIWIEILSRHHDVLYRQRIDHDGDTIRIGRGYNNDVIVDDPYIAAHHITLKRDADGNWTAFDQQTQNGMMVGGKKQRCAEVLLQDNTVICIGRTWFRLRSLQAPVVPERPLPRLQNHTWRMVFLISLAVTLIEVASIWLGQAGEYKPTQYMAVVLATVAIILTWTSLWAINSRIFSAQAHFERHLLIALTGLLILSLSEEIIAVGAYAVSLPVLSQYYFVAVWSIISVTIVFHLRAISPARPRLKILGVGLLALVAISAQWINQQETRNNSGTRAFLQQLKPHAMRLIPARTASEFFADAGTLKAALDRARTEEKPEGSGVDEDADE